MAKKDEKRISEIAKKVGDKNNADIILYNGPIYEPFEQNVIKACPPKEQRKPNVLLILVTFGGSAHTAYRICRFLQRNYEQVIIYVPSKCASAGTLLAIGANKLIVSEFGELSPIDVQLQKQDELGESDSGLVIPNALQALQSHTYSAFETFLMEARDRTGYQLSTRSCLSIAEKLTVGLFSPIYAQIEPNRIGEASRFVRIASDYGTRLNARVKSLKYRALAQLVTGYPSHNFVVDRDEIEELFDNVYDPTPEEAELATLLGLGPYDINRKRKDIEIKIIPQAVELDADKETIDGSGNGRAKKTDRVAAERKRTEISRSS